MARASDGESVLHKHLRVLGTFEAPVPFLTLSEISERAGLAPSTAHRIVGELEREGLLERLPDRTYRLGVRLWELACRTPGALGLRELARPYLQAVHARVRQHTQLGVLSDTEVLFLDRLSARDAVVNATLIGGRIPLHASSSGLVLLAHSGQAVVDAVLAAPLRRYTPHTIQTEAELHAALRRVRSDGWAVCDGHIHEESRGIAVPVYGAHQRRHRRDRCGRAQRRRPDAAAHRAADARGARDRRRDARRVPAHRSSGGDCRAAGSGRW